MTGSHICLGANDCMGSQNLGESLATMTPGVSTLQYILKGPWS